MSTSEFKHVKNHLKLPSYKADWICIDRKSHYHQCVKWKSRALDPILQGFFSCLQFLGCHVIPVWYEWIPFCCKMLVQRYQCIYSIDRPSSIFSHLCLVAFIREVELLVDVFGKRLHRQHQLTALPGLLGAQPCSLLTTLRWCWCVRLCFFYGCLCGNILLNLLQALGSCKCKTYSVRAKCLQY